MDVWDWLILFVVVYVIVGALFAGMLNQTPYSDNGWLVNGLFWPLYLWAILRGGL
jgi:hypothetical protein